jgi:hypothetical protein
VEHLYLVKRKAHTLDIGAPTLRKPVAHDLLEPMHVLVHLARPAVHHLLAVDLIRAEYSPEDPIDDVLPLEGEERCVKEPARDGVGVAHVAKAAREQPPALLGPDERRVHGGRLEALLAWEVDEEEEDDLGEQVAAEPWGEWEASCV